MTTLPQNPDDQEFSPRAKYIQAQRHLLKQVEGKHDAEPDKAAVIIAFGMSAVEAGVAFILLLPAGALIAAVGALFPVLLLWGMANYDAQRFDLIHRLDQLVEQYNEIDNP